LDKSKVHVAVIGGGCAGLSTAANLVDEGYEVTIFEASSQFGGRARMVMVENNQEMTMLDNGQHIMLGAYHDTLELLNRVGVNESDAFIRTSLHMHMLSPLINNPFRLKVNPKHSAPYHLLFALLKAEGLSFTERLRAVRMMHAVKKQKFQLLSDQPLADLLAEYKQSPRIIKVLWEPLCLAALNTPISIASAQIFLYVLRDSFNGDKTNSDFLLPKLDLSQVIANPLSQYVYENGGHLKLSSRVRSIEVELNQDGLDHFKVETKTGYQHFSHVVMAVSPARLDKLLAKMPKLSNTAYQLQKMQSQPIYTVYIQYPKEVELPEMMTGMTDSISQWIFDRGLLCKQKGLIAVIISGEGLHQSMTQDELALEVINELYQAFNDLPKPLWYKVIAEKRATFSCNSNMTRPTHKTMQPRLFLAGDYTYADYPATIEGAIRSGFACAELVDRSTRFK
jgi:squalene-associated FAD-dependent desaturase